MMSISSGGIGRSDERRVGVEAEAALRSRRCRVQIGDDQRAARIGVAVRAAVPAADALDEGAVARLAVVLVVELVADTAT